VNLELGPVHDALRQLLDPGLVRQFADLVEHPRATAGEGNKAGERQRSEFVKGAWVFCETFLRQAQAEYAARSGREKLAAREERPADSTAEAQAFARALRAAMRMPELEALFAKPWTAAARRVLPSGSPQFMGTKMWGPVLGWCALELLAESIDAKEPERTALDLFDRLRLREPFARAFAALDFEGEEAWRVAARMKVLLLVGAGVGREKEGGASEDAPSQVSKARPGAPADLGEVAPSQVSKSRPGAPGNVGLTPALWLDPDVRWLCGVHEAEGHFYLIRELYEELLWWLLMPSLLRLARETLPTRAAVEELSKTVAGALKSAEAAGYCVDMLLGPLADVGEQESATQEAEPEEASMKARKPQA
jgi:hypothetical protein